jgi:NAD(P)H-hydrate epimerase
MKHYLVTASEMQKMDKETIKTFGLPGIVLMENAGRCAVDFFMSQFSDLPDKRIGIIAGSGNNGGDGFVMARYFISAGEDVIVFLMTKNEKLSGDARFNYERLLLMNATIIEIPDEDSLNPQYDFLITRNIWIDALLGTGLRSDVKGRYRRIITFLNISKHPIFAVDIPSGLHADTGDICGKAIKANATITFGHQKIGLAMPSGEQHCGKLAIADIGIPRQITKSIAPKQYLLTSQTIDLNLYNRPSAAHKGTTGHVLVIGGSIGKTGACAMTSHAAMRIGCGLVTLGIPKTLNSVLETQLMEVMTQPLTEEIPGVLGLNAFDEIMQASQKKKCIAIGPGMGNFLKTEALIQKLIQKINIPMVIDADAINALAGQAECLHKSKVMHILTPHPGEMARLTGLSTKEIQSDRVTFAQHFARSHHVILVLKGEKTVIAHPDGRIAINPTGNSGMASGGMGDVLTGMIAGIIAQNIKPENAVETAVYLHGMASDMLQNKMGKIGFMASDVIKTIPLALEKCASANGIGPTNV